jgi:hypothetical protein
MKSSVKFRLLSGTGALFQLATIIVDTTMV